MGGLTKALNPFNPKHDLEKAIDPAGSTIRAYTGNPTNARTVLDPGNAVFPKPAPGYANYSGSGNGSQQITGPFINPATNMAQGASPPPMNSFNQAQGTPGPVSSFGGLGGKNQIPMPQPQPGVQPGQNVPRWGIGPTPTGQQAM